MLHSEVWPAASDDELDHLGSLRVDYSLMWTMSTETDRLLGPPTSGPAPDVATLTPSNVEPSSYGKTDFVCAKKKKKKKIYFFFFLIFLFGNFVH